MKLDTPPSRLSQITTDWADLFEAHQGPREAITEAQRRLLVQYPKRQVGQRMFGGESSHLPLKMNVSGVIPPIFASSHRVTSTSAGTRPRRSVTRCS